MKHHSRYHGVIILGINFVAMLLLWRRPEVLALVTLLLGFLLLRIRPRYGSYLATVAVGLAVEALVVHVGIWGYAAPSIWGVPFWIPLAWGNLKVAGLPS